MERAFRFGYQLHGDDLADPIGAAVDAERAGFDIVLASDHVGPGNAPMVTLAAIAAATGRLRIGTLVLNNDMRNPVQLAWEAATLDRISGGRFELGLGAGHTPQEYGATGIPFDPPAVRKARLMESVEVIRQLLDGDTVTFSGAHVSADDATIALGRQVRVPILVGGNGQVLLEHAGGHADIVGLQGLGRTLADGHAHETRWSPAWLDTQIDQVRAGAGDRFDEIEFNALVQVVQITDTAAQTDAAIADICESVVGLTSDDARSIPYLLVGTEAEIVAKIHECRDRWGITYFVVRDRATFGGVIGTLG